MHTSHRASLLAQRRRAMLSRLLLGWGAVLACAAPAHAAFQLNNVGLQCSESLVIQEGDAYVLSCAGDLSVQGLGGQGSFQADTSIRLSATGTLSLSDVVLRAPVIALYGEVGVQMLGSQTGLVGTNVTVNSPGAVNLGGFIDASGDVRLGTVPPDNSGGIGGGDAGSVISVPGTGGLDLNAGGGEAPGGGRQEGGDIVSGGGSLGSNDPKFGDTQLPTLGSPVPETSTVAMTLLGLLGLAGLRARAGRDEATHRAG